MKNINLLLALALLLMPIAFAENLQSFSTEVTLRVDNTTITVEGENNAKMTQVWTQSNSSAVSKMNIPIYRNVTIPSQGDMVNRSYVEFLQRQCGEVVSNLSYSSQNILSALTITGNYYPMYASCSVNLTKCEAELIVHNAVVLERDNYKKDLDKSQIDYNGLRNQYSVCNSELDTCKKDNSKNFQNVVISFILGAGIVYAYFRYKEREREGKHPAENAPGLMGKV